jgi:hypothetical protein
VRRAVLALLLIVVVAAFAAVVNLFVPLPGGPLAEGGGGFSVPKGAGRVLTIGTFRPRNDGRRPLVIEEIDLPELTGIDYLGTVVRRSGPDGPYFVVEEGYPPSDRTIGVGRVRPAEGLRLGSDEATELLIGFRGEPGDYRITPVEVVYRVELLGRLGIRFRRKLATDLTICLRKGDVLADCAIPETSN